MEALFQIEAVSKSNARLLGIRIPQYVIGQSFDTEFIITNLDEQKSQKIELTIEVRMDEHRYGYRFNLPELPSRASYVTAEINWEVLNQGICTFSIGNINPVYPGIMFVDKNKNQISFGQMFHKVVTTTPEGIYEYLAMIISAIGLTIIALEKIWPLLFEVLNFNLSR